MFPFFKDSNKKEALLTKELNRLRNSSITSSCFVLFIKGYPYEEVLKVIGEFKDLPTISLCIELSEGLFLVFTETNGKVGLDTWLKCISEKCNFELLAIRINCLTGMAWCLQPEKNVILDVAFKTAEAFDTI